MVAWEVTGKEVTQGLEVGRAATEAAVSLAEMEATEAKVETEGSVLQGEMVVMEETVASRPELPSQQPRTRVSQGEKSSACFGQSCAREFSPRQSAGNPPPPPPHRQRNLTLLPFGRSRQSLNHPKLSAKGWLPCPYLTSPTSNSNTF